MSHPPNAKPLALAIVDFCMCWLALMALANAAIVMVSFTVEIRLSLFEQPVTTDAQRLVLMGWALAYSAVGFAYMLWRYRWKCGLSTLMKIAAFVAVVFAAAPALRPDRTVATLAFVFALGFGVITYAVIWARRPKPVATS